MAAVKIVLTFGKENIFATNFEIMREGGLSFLPVRGSGQPSNYIEFH